MEGNKEGKGKGEKAEEQPPARRPEGPAPAERFSGTRSEGPSDPSSRTGGEEGGLTGGDPAGLEGGEGGALAGGGPAGIREQTPEKKGGKVAAYHITPRHTTPHHTTHHNT